MLNMDDRCVFPAIHLFAISVLGPKDIPGTLPRKIMFSAGFKQFFKIPCSYLWVRSIAIPNSKSSNMSSIPSSKISLHCCHYTFEIIFFLFKKFSPNPWKCCQQCIHVPINVKPGNDLGILTRQIYKLPVSSNLWNPLFHGCINKAIIQLKQGRGRDYMTVDHVRYKPHS